MAKTDDGCYCVLCALTFEKPTDATLHLKSEYHAYMVLATTGLNSGFHYPFPSLYYCLLCSIRFTNRISYEEHFIGTKHKTMSQFLRKLCNGEERNIKIVNLCANYSENINRSTPSICYCEVCDIQFHTSSCLGHHLKSKSHTNIKKFLRIMSRWKCVKATSLSAEKFMIKLINGKGMFKESPILFCEVCNGWCFNTKSYHSQSKANKHRRMEQLMNEMFPQGRDLNVYFDNQPQEKFNDFGCFGLYCQVCNMSFSNVIIYDVHLKSKKHEKYFQIMNKKSIGKEQNSSNIGFDYPTSKTVKTLYSLKNYCRLCQTQFPDFTTYDKHMKCTKHKDNDHIMSKTFAKENETTCGVTLASKAVRDFYSSKNYCKLCEIQFPNFNCYDRHLKGKCHKSDVKTKIKKVTSNKTLIDIRWADEETSNKFSLPRFSKLRCVQRSTTKSYDHTRKKRDFKAVQKSLKKPSKKEVTSDRSRDVFPVHCEGKEQQLARKRRKRKKKLVRKTSRWKDIKFIESFFGVNNARSMYKSSYIAFCCEFCNYKSYGSSSFKEHLSSFSHIRIEESIGEMTKRNKKTFTGLI